MATQVIMPQMGLDMKAGKVVRWIKREGDQVSQGEALAEIETDKAVVEVEASASGVLKKIAIGEGVTVPVGQVLGIIGAPEEDLAQVAEGTHEAPIVAEGKSSEELLPLTQMRHEPASPVRAEESRVRASPLAKKEAEARHVDLKQVKGKGPGGRITREDVIDFAEKKAPGVAAKSGNLPGPSQSPAQHPAPPGGLAPLNRMRLAVAGAMARSKREIPHFYVTVEIDMTEAVKLRAMLNEALEKDARISINDLVLKAAAKTLQKHPVFNASYTDRGLQMHPQINVGMAIALPEGLIAPAITDTPPKPLTEIARTSRQLVERAKSGVLTANEYSNATFTVTNLGMYQVESFGAIITPPQSAALAVGAVRKAPAVRDGQLAIADVLKATMSVDHRGGRCPGRPVPRGPALLPGEARSSSCMSASSFLR